MSKILPANIEHVQLDGLAFKPKQKGYCYLVFWWYSIPLGDLYIEFDGQEPNNSKLNKAIINAIAPTIDFYAAKYKPKGNYQKEFISGNYDVFKKIMAEIFSACLPVDIPSKVGVSVVICTRNRSQDLKLCIESLLKQTCLPEEIIVVDNAPTDNSTQLIAEQYKDVTYCKEERPGLDIARNSGALKAKNQIVAYTDDDVQVHPLWTYRVWETFLKEDVHAMTGLVLASSLDTESQQIFEKHWAFNKGYLYKVYNNQFIKENLKVGPKVWDIGAGANMAFRKQVLAKVNWFDERLDVGAAGCSGDSEIWFRVLENNFNIQYNPQAVVYHEHRKELGKLHKQLFNYMRGFAAAALIQHDQNKHAGYRKHLFYKLPQYYFYLLVKGFPSYKFNHRTVFSEIHGLLSGIKFYYQNRKKPAIRSGINKV
ncbi:MAG: glycosyltransferase family 2 protein [Mucilaginibacter sp.]|uniref:glycosyltransferase family 2 protein n=1 Tax=Mucilaginibacter sp. TaxID=1882438 RepID=UPI0034E3E16D